MPSARPTLLSKKRPRVGSALVLLLFVSAGSALAGCRGQRKVDGGALDAGATDDGGEPAADGGEVARSCGPGGASGSVSGSGACAFSPGDPSSRNLVVQGTLVTGDGLLENGTVVIGEEGKILCAGCDCGARPESAGAPSIRCPTGVVSPGLINAHDHVTFTEAPPAPHPGEVFEHRHDWRRGQDGHTRIPSISNRGGDHGIWWGELRNVMAGATSINGSGGAAGLLRNLDQPEPLQEGLGQPRVRYSTFPLGDTDGTTRETNCMYGTIDRATSPAIESADAYSPHIAEGIDRAARNEFLCLSSSDRGGSDVMSNKTAVIHGIGLLASDFNAMSLERASLIWSPRSNIDLYGNTAQVVLAANAGVRIALGSDWAISGSMNILRELRCASEFNRRNLGGHFSDRQLVEMATVNAAAALKSDDHIGALEEGLDADLTIWRATARGGYRAILDAEPGDVVLVLRSGVPLYGDADLVSALPEGGGGCEPVTVCGEEKRVCAERETGATIGSMRAAIASNAYDLFFCGPPPNEPTCVPFRPNEYMGIASTTDRDGDGIADTLDNCPSVFNPTRPLDESGQADADQDLVGDACDPCPLSPMSMGCATPDALDRDGDTVRDVIDNCADVSNADQSDVDGDATGDACDACPSEPNPAGAPCTARIYDVKQGTIGGQARIRNALVTAVAPTGYFVQVVPGDAGFDVTLNERFSGLFVYTGSRGEKPTQGDRIDVAGMVADHYGQKQLTNGSFTVLASGQAMPEPIRATPLEIGSGGSRADELEAVLVEVIGVTVTSTTPPVGPGDRAPTREFVVDAALRVNDFMHLVTPFPALGDVFGDIRGILRLANDDHKLEPRSADDIGVTERLIGIRPETSSIAAGMAGVPPGGLAVVLSRAARAPIAVSLSSSSPSTVVPGTVTVPAGASSADVSLSVAASERGVVTLTASLGGDTVTSRLFVYDDATPRTITRLSLTPSELAPGGSAIGVVSIDLPGQASGTDVELDVAPVGLAMAPRTITVPAGRDSGSFTLTAALGTGSGTLSARLGPSMASAMFSVTRSTSRTPQPGDLVITEIFRNPNGTVEKEREWFEIWNPTTDEILIDGLSVADNVSVHVLSGPGLSVPPDGYAVIGYTSDVARNGGIPMIAEYESSDIQLANSDDILTLSYQGTTIDVVDWASGWPGGANGTSMCLRFPYATDNGVASAWSNAVGTFGALQERGHPGIPSDPTNCP